MLYADVNTAIKTTRDPGGLIGLMLCLVVASFFRALAGLIEQVVAGKLAPAPVAPAPVFPAAHGARPTASRTDAAPAPASIFTETSAELPPPVDDAATRALNRAFAYLLADWPTAASAPVPLDAYGVAKPPRPPFACVGTGHTATRVVAIRGTDHRGVSGPAAATQAPPMQRRAVSEPSWRHSLTNRPPLSKRVFMPSPCCV